MAELPIADFLRERLKEYDPTFEVRKGTPFDTLLFKPMQYILQPFRDEADQLFIGESLLRILQTENPDAFSETLVDELVANVFVTRRAGNKSSGVARVYYDAPVDREYPVTGFVVSGNNSLNYTNPAPYIVTQAQMSAQIEAGLYYFDIPIVSQDTGANTELLSADSLVSVVNDSDVIFVTNKSPIRGGVDRELNTALIERARNAITVRDLVTGKGFVATLFENFPDLLTEIQAIGFGDKEMMRDIVFNTHIGGKHDGYVKTPSIHTTYKDFIGILIDETRQAFTSNQFTMTGTVPQFMGETNIDRTIAAPTLRQVKPFVAAVFTGIVDLVTTQANLVNHEYVKITIDGVTKTVRVAGAVPSSTKRTEIITAINNAFGVTVAFPYGNYIRLVSTSPGRDSMIQVEDPTLPLQSGLIRVFGNPAPEASWLAVGDGPLYFQEDVHYSVNDSDGTMTRIIPGTYIVPSGSYTTTILQTPVTNPPTMTALVEANHVLSPILFVDVEVNDILTITSGIYAGDYRIIEKLSDELIRIDTPFTADVHIDNIFYIKRTGIKSGELVYTEFYFNPLSIDIGKYIQLDDLGRVRGIRTGREAFTITDIAFLKINSIESIDPVSGEPLGEVLNGRGGYGLGGYGLGSYGIGSASDYRLIVNVPTARFSAFEDSYIVFNSAFQGYSLRVNYDYVPEVETIHTFCRSESERVLDGDILVKHFIPAYVSGEITYRADDTDTTIPANDQLTEMVKNFISIQKANTTLQISDVVQYILSVVDPYKRYTGYVKPFTLVAEIHNTDGSLTIVESSEELIIPTPDPFPKETDRPLSARTAHWIAGDITMVRL